MHENQYSRNWVAGAVTDQLEQELEGNYAAKTGTYQQHNRSWAGGAITEQQLNGSDSNREVGATTP